MLRRVLPPDTRVLEIASGAGEHAVYFAAALPGVRWRPSDPAAKKYRITGDNRQRVWTVCEKGQQMQMVIVFDSNSRVVDKEIWKSLPILDSFGE